MADKKIRNDLILVGAMVAVLLLALACFLLLRSEGDTVVVTVMKTVTVDGKEQTVKEIYGTYPLNKNIEVDIRTGESGEQFNRLIIKDGQAYIEDANCPGGDGNRCTVHTPISYEWDSIICRPHKVVVSIEAGK